MLKYYGKSIINKKAIQFWVAFKVFEKTSLLFDIRFVTI